MKKFLAVVLFAMLFAFAACAAEGTPAVPAPEVPAAAPEVAPEVAPEAPAAVEEPGEQVFRVGISLPPILNDFHATMMHEIENAIANAPPNFEFTLTGSNDAGEQVMVLETFATMGFDGIIISPWDGSLVGPVAEYIYNMGTPVVVINRMIDPPVFTSFVAGDNPGGSALMAHYIGEFLGGEGTVVTMRMVAGTPIDADRQYPFLEVMETYFPNIEILCGGQGVEGGNNREGGYDAAMILMQRFPHIDVIYGHDEFAARGALQAFDDAGRTELRLATGWSGTKEFLAEIEEQGDAVRLRVAAYLPVMGATAVQAMIDILNGEEVERYTIDPPLVLGPHNVDEWAHMAF